MSKMEENRIKIINVLRTRKDHHNAHSNSSAHATLHQLPLVRRRNKPATCLQAG